MRQFGLCQHIPVAYIKPPVKGSTRPLEWAEICEPFLTQWENIENYVEQERDPAIPLREYMTWYWNITRRWVLFAPEQPPTAYAPSGPHMRSLVDMALHNYVQCVDRTVPPETRISKIKKKILDTLKCTGCISSDEGIEDLIRSNPTISSQYQQGAGTSRRRRMQETEAGGSSQQGRRSSHHEIEEHGPTPTQPEEEAERQEESPPQPQAPRQPVRKRPAGGNGASSSRTRGRGAR